LKLQRRLESSDKVAAQVKELQGRMVSKNELEKFRRETAQLNVRESRVTSILESNICDCEQNYHLVADQEYFRIS
jgi:hypothetical protein